eukprot:1160640-Pelagomonas_calceolata.AAC.11
MPRDESFLGLGVAIRAYMSTGLGWEGPQVGPNHPLNTPSCTPEGHAQAEGMDEARQVENELKTVENQQISARASNSQFSHHKFETFGVLKNLRLTNDPSLLIPACQSNTMRNGNTCTPAQIMLNAGT